MYCSGEGTQGQTGNGVSHVVLTEVDPSIVTWAWEPYAYENTMIASMSATSPLDIRAWGLNDWGQGGAGNMGINMMTPTTPIYIPTPFSYYAIGAHHACGMEIALSGKVLCIGNNAFGRCFAGRWRG
jgi:hypothetical protein